MRRFAYSLFASLTLIAGCLEGAPDKGEEDDVPADGKADSFREPTEHGAVPFSGSSSASFTAAQGFHSWTFKLTGSGKVDLQTDAHTDSNADTVAYLYKKTGSSWGAYIATNDDASSSTSDSRIKKQLTAGEYRLIVKAYKRTQRGAFDVLATCTGAGCPVPEVCTDPAELPAPTGYTAACGAKLAAVFETGLTTEGSYEEGIAYTTRCDVQSPLVRKAMDYYARYWGVLEGDPENDNDEDFFYNVESYTLSATSANGGGTLVKVDDGGDESTMRFLFDKSGELLAYYQDNQSPDIAFFCGTGPEIQLPNAEECLNGLTGGVPHGTNGVRTLNLTSAPNNLPTGTQSVVRAAFNRYKATNATAASTKLTASGKTWVDHNDNTTGIFSLTAPSKPATRYVVGNDLVLLEAPAGGAAALVCE